MSRKHKNKRWDWGVGNGEKYEIKRSDTRERREERESKKEGTLGGKE